MILAQRVRWANTNPHLELKPALIVPVICGQQRRDQHNVPVMLVIQVIMILAQRVRWANTNPHLELKPALIVPVICGL